MLNQTMNPGKTIEKKMRAKTHLPGTVISSINTQMAGSEFAKNNARETVLYNDPHDPLNNRIFNMINQANPGITVGTIDKYKNIKPGRLSFIFYDEPGRSPNEPGYDPQMSGDIDTLHPNFHRVFSFTPDSKFTDGMKHQCLGILYDNKRLKIKYSGSNPETGFPYFYVEDPIFEYDTVSGKVISAQQAKWYGTFNDIPVSGSSFGKRTFNSLKKVTDEIKYLKKL